MDNTISMDRIDDLGLKSFIIDNSALNNLLQTDDNFSILCGFLSKNDVVLYIPVDTISEAIGGKEIDRIHSRFLRLDSLIEKFTTKVVMTSGVRDVLKKEIRSNGRIPKFADLRGSPRWKGYREIFSDRSKLQEIMGKSVNDKESIASLKKELVSNDKVLRDESRKTSIDDNWIRESLRNLKLADCFGLISAFVGAFPGLSNTKARRIFQKGNADKFIYLKTYLTLMRVRALGNSMKSYATDDCFKFLEKLKEGNWFDLGIIAHGCRTDFLITDDKNQHKLCEYLCTQGVIKCHPFYSKDLVKAKF